MDNQILEICNPKELAETIRENMAPQIMTVDRGSLEKGTFLLLPKGMEAQSVQKFLEEQRETPKRRTGTINLTQTESFVEIVHRFKNANSTLFAHALIADQSIEASIEAIFDYHPISEDVKDAENCGHRAKYEFPTTKQFQDWLAQNNQPMTQIELAHFMVQRVMEMTTPTENDKAQIESLKPKFADPVDILELSRDLEIYSQEAVTQRNTLSSGEREIKFTTQHTDAGGNAITIPDFFVINIPVFEGSAPQRILVQLFYRKKDTGLVWWYSMYRIDRALELSFQNTCKTVQEACGLPLYFGTPE